MSLKQDFAELVKSQSEIWRAQTKDYQDKLEHSGATQLLMCRKRNSTSDLGVGDPNLVFEGGGRRWI